MGKAEHTEEVAELNKEIEAGVDAVIQAKRGGEGEPTAEADDKGGDDSKEVDVPEEETPADEGETPDDKGEAEVPPEKGAVSDDLLTRAVKAGMSLADARAIQDAQALERMCGLLEKQSGEEKGDDGEEAKDAAKANSEKDPLDAIPDLDPEEFDDEIVSVVKGLKELIRSQRDELRELRKQTTNTTREAWMDGKVEALGLESVPPEKRQELESAFDALMAGYEATGKEVSRDVAFEQAAGMILSDEARAAKEAKQKKALEKREKIQTVRPGGSAVKPKGDPMSEVAEEIDRKFFDRK